MGFSVLFLVEVPYLPHASTAFFQRFDARIVELMQETHAKLQLVRKNTIRWFLLVGCLGSTD
jgi:hypothetical protein